MVSQGNGREYRSLGLSEGLRRDCEAWEWWFMGQRRSFGSLLRWPSSTSKWSRCERRGYGRCSVMIRRRFERVSGRNKAWGASEGICTDSVETRCPDFWETPDKVKWVAEKFAEVGVSSLFVAGHVSRFESKLLSEPLPVWSRERLRSLVKVIFELKIGIKFKINQNKN